MNILIVDEEVYLAQKVAIKLQEEGHSCTHVSNIKEVNFDLQYDTVLLSTNISSADVEKIIKKLEFLSKYISILNEVTFYSAYGLLLFIYRFWIDKNISVMKEILYLISGMIINYLKTY